MASEVILVPGIMTANHRKIEGTWRSICGAGQEGIGQTWNLHLAPPLAYSQIKLSHVGYNL